MNRIDLQFILLGAAMLVIGVVIGIYMAASHAFQYMPIHAHVLVVGWLSLTVFGLVYRAYPALAQRRLARAHFLLAALAAVLLPVGIGLALFAASEALAIVASLLWLGACIIFFVQLLALVFAKAGEPSLAPAE